MKCIVVVDNMWGIGKNNTLLFRLKADMRHFVEKTTGKAVVMGSNNLLSLPNAAPLKNRTNIVLWPGGKQRDDLTLVESLDGLFTEINKYDADDVYVIGGAMLYRTLLPYCSEAEVTKVFANGDAAVFFDNLDLLPNWKLDATEPAIIDGDYKIQFCTYKNTSPLEYRFTT